MENQQLTRKELYELVWSHPLSHLSRELDISTSSIKTICKNHDIPLPKLGHWIKLEFGKEVDIIPLELGPSLDEKKIELIEQKGKVNPHMTRLSERTKEILNAHPVESKCPQRLSNPDPLVRIAKTYLLTSDASTYEFENGVKTRREMISICVSKPNIFRACRFMDGFIKLIKARGHEFGVDGRDTYVVVNSQRYKIRCREKCHRKSFTDRRWTRSKLIPNGKLSLKLDDLYDKEWRDTKTPIEEKLAQIIAGFELRAEDDIAKEARRKIERERRLKLEEIRKRLEAEKEWELKKVEILKNHAAQWKLYNDVKDFIDAIENQNMLQSSDPSELKNWLQWAKEIENFINPLTKGVGHLIEHYSFNFEASTVYKM